MFINEQTLLPGQNVVEKLLTAKRLQDYIRVLLLCSGEEYQLIVVAQGSKHLDEMRSKFYINLQP